MKLKEQERNIISESTTNIYKIIIKQLFGISDDSTLKKDESSYSKVLYTINNYKEA